jgi:hypothetical protein
MPYLAAALSLAPSIFSLLLSYLPLPVPFLLPPLPLVRVRLRVRVKVGVREGKSGTITITVSRRKITVAHRESQQTLCIYVVRWVERIALPCTLLSRRASLPCLLLCSLVTPWLIWTSLSFSCLVLFPTI